MKAVPIHVAKGLHEASELLQRRTSFGTARQTARFSASSGSGLVPAQELRGRGVGSYADAMHDEGLKFGEQRFDDRDIWVSEMRLGCCVSSRPTFSKVDRFRYIGMRTMYEARPCMREAAFTFRHLTIAIKKESTRPSAIDDRSTDRNRFTTALHQTQAVPLDQ